MSSNAEKHTRPNEAESESPDVDREDTGRGIDKEHILALERPQTHCAECNAPLSELDRHPTRLIVRGGEPRRADFCPDCWEFAKEEAYDSYWITRRVKKEKRAPRLSRREKAVAVRALFESLWEKREAEEVEAHIYFLAHLLLKWGGLKWKGTEVDAEGREIVVFENPITGDPIEIRSVDASEEAIAEIRDRIEAFLREYAPDDETLLE
jgi:hypothetical protein